MTAATGAVTVLLLQPIASTDLDLAMALAAEKLPTDDLADAGRNFFRITRGAETVGFGGYELYGDNALLRSLVIAPCYRGTGLGRLATRLLLRRAQQHGARHAYLLTSSAADFFEGLGFSRIDRAAAPEVIQQTRQASMLCPSSAVLMTQELRF